PRSEPVDAAYALVGGEHVRTELARDRRQRRTSRASLLSGRRDRLVGRRLRWQRSRKRRLLTRRFSWSPPPALRLLSRRGAQEVGEVVRFHVWVCQRE